MESTPLKERLEILLDERMSGSAKQDGNVPHNIVATASP
jgi:hypothetical protein